MGDIILYGPCLRIRWLWFKVKSRFGLLQECYAIILDLNKFW